MSLFSWLYKRATESIQLFALALALPALTTAQPTDNPNVNYDPPRQKIEATEGADTYELEVETEPRKVTYRVFGYNRNPFYQRKNSLALAPSLLILGSAKEVGETYDRNFCEKDALGTSFLYAVVPSTTTARSEIDRLTEQFSKRRGAPVADKSPRRDCAEMTVRSALLKRFLKGGIAQDLSQEVIDDSRMPYKFKHQEFLYVDEIRETVCP